jgi:hypothetical protein
MVGSISTVSSLASITSSIHSITKDKLESIFEVGMTQQERDQYTYQQICKVMIEKNKIYNSLFPESKEEKEEIYMESDQVTQKDANQNQQVHNRSLINFSSSLETLNTKYRQVTRSAKHDKEELSNKPDDDPSKIISKSNANSKSEVCCEAVSNKSADKLK